MNFKDLGIFSDREFNCATVLRSGQRPSERNGPEWQTLTLQPEDSFLSHLAARVRTEPRYVCTRKSLRKGKTACVFLSGFVSRGVLRSDMGYQGNSGFLGIYKWMLKTTKGQELTRRGKTPWDKEPDLPALLIKFPLPPPSFHLSHWMMLDEPGRGKRGSFKKRTK